MIDTYRNQIKEMEKEIQQLKTVEVEMLTSISILKDINDTYAKDIGMLQKETDITIVTANTSQSPQENLDQDNSSVNTMWSILQVVCTLRVKIRIK
nr:unnamed protein product [Callosobruchus analis]